MLWTNVLKSTPSLPVSHLFSYMIHAIDDSTAVVVAFRAAYSLETKRRDNDRKIKALFAGMGEMMAVLEQYAFLRFSRAVPNRLFLFVIPQASEYQRHPKYIGRWIGGGSQDTGSMQKDRL